MGIRRRMVAGHHPVQEPLSDQSAVDLLAALPRMIRPVRRVRPAALYDFCLGFMGLLKNAF
jgi:hypothetical protein